MSADGHVEGCTFLQCAPHGPVVLPSDGARAIRQAEGRAHPGLASEREEDVIEAPRRRARIISGDKISYRVKKSLWHRRIPLGEITVISGIGGLGKSTIAIDLAASVTRGVLPGHLEGKPRNVLIVAAEDDLEGTVAPRADACGAVMSRVKFLAMEAVDGAEDQLKLSVDMAELERVILEENISLVVLDPITALMSGVKLNDEGEVRSVLTPLADIAHRTECTFILIMHFNKSKGDSAAMRTIGSVAFNNAARANLSVARMSDIPEGGHDCIIAVVKSNVGPLGQGLTFRMDTKKVGETEEGDVEAGRVNWGEESELNIEDLMAMAEDNSVNKDAAADCSDWMKHYLVDRGGSAEYADLKKAGVVAGGFTDYALRGAKKKLGLHSRQFGQPKKSLWGFPDAFPEERAVVRTTPAAISQNGNVTEGDDMVADITAMAKRISGTQGYEELAFSSPDCSDPVSP